MACAPPLVALCDSSVAIRTACEKIGPTETRGPAFFTSSDAELNRSEEPALECRLRVRSTNRLVPHSNASFAPTITVRHDDVYGFGCCVETLRKQRINEPLTLVVQLRGQTTEVFVNCSPLPSTYVGVVCSEPIDRVRFKTSSTALTICDLTTFHVATASKEKTAHAPRPPTVSDLTTNTATATASGTRRPSHSVKVLVDCEADTDVSATTTVQQFLERKGFKVLGLDQKPAPDFTLDQKHVPDFTVLLQRSDAAVGASAMTCADASDMKHSAACRASKWAIDVYHGTGPANTAASSVPSRRLWWPADARVLVDDMCGLRIVEPSTGSSMRTPSSLRVCISYADEPGVDQVVYDLGSVLRTQGLATHWAAWDKSIGFLRNRKSWLHGHLANTDCIVLVVCTARYASDATSAESDNSDAEAPLVRRLLTRPDSRSRVINVVPSGAELKGHIAHRLPGSSDEYFRFPDDQQVVGLIRQIVAFRFGTNLPLVSSLRTLPTKERNDQTERLFGLLAHNADLEAQRQPDQIGDLAAAEKNRMRIVSERWDGNMDIKNPSPTSEERAFESKRLVNMWFPAPDPSKLLRCSDNKDMTRDELRQWTSDRTRLEQTFSSEIHVLHDSVESVPLGASPNSAILKLPRRFTESGDDENSRVAAATLNREEHIYKLLEKKCLLFHSGDRFPKRIWAPPLNGLSSATTSTNSVSALVLERWGGDIYKANVRAAVTAADPRHGLARVMFLIGLSTMTMHREQLLHCDIKPHNFLVRIQHRTMIEACLCDFGLTSCESVGGVLFDDTITARTLEGMIADGFAAPEVVLSTDRQRKPDGSVVAGQMLTLLADVTSFALSTIQVLMDVQPFRSFYEWAGKSLLYGEPNRRIAAAERWNACLGATEHLLCAEAKNQDGFISQKMAELLLSCLHFEWSARSRTDFHQLVRLLGDRGNATGRATAKDLSDLALATSSFAAR